MRPLLIGSEIYRGSTYGPKHPLAIPRVSTTLDLIRALGWVGPDQYIESPRASPSVLPLVFPVIIDAEAREMAQP